jgi:hypothetical protein
VSPFIRSILIGAGSATQESQKGCRS